MGFLRFRSTISEDRILDWYLQFRPSEKKDSFHHRTYLKNNNKKKANKQKETKTKAHDVYETEFQEYQFNSSVNPGKNSCGVHQLAAPLPFPAWALPRLGDRGRLEGKEEKLKILLAFEGTDHQQMWKSFLALDTPRAALHIQPVCSFPYHSSTEASQRHCGVTRGTKGFAGDCKGMALLSSSVPFPPSF